MVSIEDDFETVLADMRLAEIEGMAQRDRLRKWITGLEFIRSRLRGNPCPECGAPMQFDPTLQTYVCHHIEDGSEGT